MVLLNLHLALLSFCFPLDFRLGQQKKITLVSENADHEKNFTWTAPNYYFLINLTEFY